MKKLLLLLTLILYFVSAAFAESVTFDFTTNNPLTSTAISDETSYTFGDYVLKMNNVKKQTATSGSKKDGILLTKSTGYITLPVFEGVVTSIVCYSNDGASKSGVVTVYQAETSLGTIDIKTQNTTTECKFDISAENQKPNCEYKLQATSAANVQITKIIVTYTPSTGGGEVTPTCTKPTVSTAGNVFTITGDAGDTFFYTLKKDDVAIETDKEYTAPIDPSTNGYGTYTLTAYATREGANKSASTEPATITIANPNAPLVFVVDKDFPGIGSYGLAKKEDSAFANFGLYSTSNTSSLQFNNSSSRTCGLYVNAKDGYLVKSVAIDWGTQTTKKDFAVYSSASAYTAVSKSETQIATLNNDNSYSYTFKSGVKNISMTPTTTGATYPASITVTFEKEVVLTPCEKPGVEVDEAQRTFTVTAKGDGETVKYILSKDGVAGEEAVYSEPIVIAEKAWGKYELRAWAEKEGFAKSEEATATFDYQPVTCAAPTVAFDEATRTFTATATEGTVKYILTVDDVAGDVTDYTAPVVIPEFAYGKYVFAAWATVAGKEDSKKAEITYDYLKPAATPPTITIEDNKFVVTGDEGDTFRYTLRQGDTAVAENEEYTAPVDPAAYGFGTFTLTARATNPNKSDSEEVTSEPITLTDPDAPQFYTITFKTGTNGTNGQTSVTVTNAVEKGGQYLSGAITGNKITVATSGGLQLGTSSASGDATLTMSDLGKVKVEKIVIRTGKYGSDTNSYSLYINGGTTAVATSLEPGTDYTYTPKSRLTLESMKIATGSSKRMYIAGVDVYIAKDLPECETPEINLDKENRTFSITAKGEGETVKYVLTKEYVAGEEQVYSEPIVIDEADYGRYELSAWTVKDGFANSDIATVVFDYANPAHHKYSIVFNTGTSIPSYNSTSVTLANGVESGAQYLSGNLTGTALTYKGVSGLGLGTTSSRGDVTLTMSDLGKVAVKKLVVHTHNFGSDTGTYSLSINNTSAATQIAKEGHFVYNVADPIILESLKIATSSQQRMYVEGIEVFYIIPERAVAPLVSIANDEVTKVGHSVAIAVPEGANDGYSFSYSLTTPTEAAVVGQDENDDVVLKLDEEGVYTLVVKGFNEYKQGGDAATLTFAAEAYKIFIENYHAYGNAAPLVHAMTYNNDTKAYEAAFEGDKELFGEFRIKSECGTLNIGGHDNEAVNREFDREGNKLGVRARAEGQDDSESFNLSERYVTIDNDSELTLMHGEGTVNFSTHTAGTMRKHTDAVLSMAIDPEAVTNATAYADDDTAPAAIEVGKLKLTSDTPAVETGVRDITVDAATGTATYYNLQGIRVLAPQPGQVLIERRGATTRKLRL